MNRSLQITVACIIIACAFWPAATQAAPTAAEILRNADQVVSPEKFSGLFEMTARRNDGSEKVYRLRLFKLNDNTRVEFEYPPLEKGRKMLRKGQEMWMMLDTLKRPLRIAAKQKLMNGDFDNGDVLRLNLVEDYNAVLAGEDDLYYHLELSAKDRTVAYDRVTIAIRKNDFSPANAQYYTVSGKLMRELEYKDDKDFNGYKRPATMIMHNAINKEAQTVMRILELKKGETLDESEFTVDSLRR
jgi:outer membrane lipoprotein-sorting protein